MAGQLTLIDSVTPYTERPSFGLRLGSQDDLSAEYRSAITEGLVYHKSPSPATQVFSTMYRGSGTRVTSLARANFFEIMVPALESQDFDDQYQLPVTIEEIVPTTPNSLVGVEKYCLGIGATTLGTSIATGRAVVAYGGVIAKPYKEKMDYMRRHFHLDIKQTAELLDTSRPTIYRIMEGGKPKNLELRHKINKLYDLSRRIRAGYATGPVSPQEITDWLSTCFNTLNRKALANKLQARRTTYGGHPNDPTKLIRTNPDGSRDVGVWANGAFVPDGK